MQENTGPWYKHFWPVFMVGLISTAVIASLTTVYIAVDGSDDLVNDNYYKDGLAINMQLDQDNLAKQLGVKAQLNIIDNEATIALSMDAQPPSQLIAKFSHPASDTKDQQIFLFADANGIYKGNISIPKQRFYVQILGAHDGAFWRLDGEITPNNNGVLLSN